MQDTSHSKHGDMFERLMEISQDALMNGHYEAAYHALAAAMHYAHDLGDRERLASVEHAAKAQQDQIDTHAPKHWMARESAVKRHVTSLYDMLARQAATHVLIIQQEHRREHSKRLAWPDDAK